MAPMSELQPIDLLAVAILGVAALRGLFLGLIREVFSIGALAAAVVAVRVWNEPFADWLIRASDHQLGGVTARWVAGALIAVGAIAGVGTFGKVMGQGARAVGLGWFDRAGGAALGVAEGAIATGALLLVIGSVLGRGHELLVSSRSLALLERFERVADVRSLVGPDVAAPPPERSTSRKESFPRQSTAQP
jgi:membrane protein required for colicin V production